MESSLGGITYMGRKRGNIMRLQDNLKDVSTVPDAFSIENFKKKTDGYYQFTSFQGFEYILLTDRYEYTYNIYSSDYTSKGSNVYDAFAELADFIDKNIESDGTLDLNKVKPHNNWVRFQGKSNHGWVTDDESAIKEVEIVEEDPLYCNCKQPNISRSHAMGVQFDYCKTCLKERVAKVTTLKSSSYNYYDDGPF